jgi:hypothetical protein
MAKISARGATEVARWTKVVKDCDMERRHTVVLRSDGVVLHKSEWRRLVIRHSWENTRWNGGGFRRGKGPAGNLNEWLAARGFAPA